MRSIRFASAALVVTLVAAAAGPASAIDKCKVKVDNKTGVITISATGVVGTLQWGSASGSENQAFFNPSCVAGGAAKGCQLANPLTLASKTPPEGCTVYLNDSSAPCSVWIRGCSPGQRNTDPVHLVWKDTANATVGASDENGQYLIRELGGVVVRTKIYGGTVAVEQLFTYYTTSDCTGTSYMTGALGNVQTGVSTQQLGPIHYAPNFGSFMAYGSVLGTDDFLVNSPGDCLFVGGGTFVAPHSCCQVTPGNAFLAPTVVENLSGITLPVRVELQ